MVKKYLITLNLITIIIYILTKPTKLFIITTIGVEQMK